MVETLPKDPVIEAYKKDVDRTLLRANLQLTRRLIEVKRAAGRPKDFEAIAELELLLKGAGDEV